MTEQLINKMKVKELKALCKSRGIKGYSQLKKPELITILNNQPESERIFVEDKPDYILYLLKNTHHKYTYLGVTNNSEKRIRAHNGEIKGGAKYTRAFKRNGKWIYHMKISNLTKSEACSMESLTKHAAKKNYKNKKSIKGKTLLERKVNLLLSFQEKFPNCVFNYI